MTNILKGDNGSFLNKKYARPTNNYWWEWNTSLELVRAFTQYEVEQTPQHEFKVGDKVKILWDKTFYNHKYYENVGVIYSIDAPYISVNHFSKRNPQFELDFIINQLELVKEPTPEFKVGDKVKILDNVEDFDNEHRKSFIGKTGTIVKIKDRSMPLVYLGKDFDGHNGSSESNNNNWWFYENNLELVKEPTPELKVDDVVNTPFGIGKIVGLLRNTF